MFDLDDPFFKPDEKPTSPFRCVHRDCKYSAGDYNGSGTRINGCNYISITGVSRIGQLPKELWDPAVCPLYVKGRKPRNYGKKIFIGDV